MKNPSDELSTHQKALAINLDQGIYGTVAEIGAGQEVARWFFRVGGAAGSVAKTMSAYDMKVSDEVYGKAGRYVSRERLQAMLKKEYRLLCERLIERRSADTRFFAFADTVAARNYTGTNHCHGWVGLRFQARPGGEHNDLILHVNMLDRTNIRQQEALGVLGVNLIYAAFTRSTFSPDCLAEFVEDLAPGRIEIDYVIAHGPDMAELTPLNIGATLVRERMAKGVLFAPDGTLAPPNEALYKRDIVIERGLFRHDQDVRPDLLSAGVDRLRAEDPDKSTEPLALLEFSVNNFRDPADVSAAEHLKRLQHMIDSGHWSLLTCLKESYSVTDYMRRYSEKPLRFVMGSSTLALLFDEKFYDQLPGGVMEAMGKLFSNNVRIYVYEMQDAAFADHIEATGINKGLVSIDFPGLITTQSLTFPSPLNLLYQFVVESGWIVDLH